MNKIAVTLEQLIRGSKAMRKSFSFRRPKGGGVAGEASVVGSDPHIQTGGQMISMITKKKGQRASPSTHKALNALRDLHEGREAQQFFSGAYKRHAMADRGGHHYDFRAWVPDLNIAATFKHPDPKIERQVKNALYDLRRNEVNLYSKYMPQHAESLQGLLQGKRVSRNKIRQFSRDWTRYTKAEKDVVEQMVREEKNNAKQALIALDKKYKRGGYKNLQEARRIGAEKQSLIDVITGRESAVVRSLDENKVMNKALENLGWK